MIKINNIVNSNIKRKLRIKWCNMMFPFFNLPPVRFIIECLADIEMKFNLYANKRLREAVDMPEYDRHTKTYKYISDDFLYCTDCIYQDRSNVIKYTYGTQSWGYCHFLKAGDYHEYGGTMILWDGCKECGENVGDEEI